VKEILVKPATIHREADAELVEAMDWYDDKRPGLGLEIARREGI
jgi:hypothetical protein